MGALFLLLSLSNIGPEGGILRRLGIHRGLRRGTIGYVRLLNVSRHMPMIVCIQLIAHVPSMPVHNTET